MKESRGKPPGRIGRFRTALSPEPATVSRKVASRVPGTRFGSGSRKQASNRILRPEGRFRRLAEDKTEAHLVRLTLTVNWPWFLNHNLVGDGQTQTRPPCLVEKNGSKNLVQQLLVNRGTGIDNIQNDGGMRRRIQSAGPNGQHGSRRRLLESVAQHGAEARITRGPWSRTVPRFSPYSSRTSLPS